VEIPLVDGRCDPLKGNALEEAKKRGEKNFKRVVEDYSTGKTIQLTLTLPVKGTYSATSPWKCEKTEAIIINDAKPIFLNVLLSFVIFILNL
jgi:hypothetical protein